MALKLSSLKNSLIEKNYPKIMGELNSFFGINWVKDQPKVIVVVDRKAFDELLGRKTEKWLVGYANNNTVYLLDGKKFKSQADREYTDEKYLALIEHELAHLFFGILNPQFQPFWLREGISLYLSGQNKLNKNIPQKIKNFLKFTNKYIIKKESVYQESGFVVEILVKKFGQGKMIQLIKSKNKDNQSFKKSFKNIYGFDLNYANINQIYFSKI